MSDIKLFKINGQMEELSGKLAALEITEDLEAALEQFATIAEDLKSS